MDTREHIQVRWVRSAGDKATSRDAAATSFVPRGARNTMVDPEHSFETFGYLENIAEEEGSEAYEDLQSRLFSPLDGSEADRRPRSSSSESSFSSFYLDDRSSSANSDSYSRYTSSREGTCRSSESSKFGAMAERNYRSPNGLGYRANSGFIEDFSTKRHLRKHIDSMLIRHKTWANIRQITAGVRQHEQRTAMLGSSAPKNGELFRHMASLKGQKKLGVERDPIKLKVKRDLIWSTERDSWQTFPNPATRISALDGYARAPLVETKNDAPELSSKIKNMKKQNKSLKFYDGNILPFSRQTAPRFAKSRIEIQQRTRAFDTVDGTNSSTLAARQASKQTWDKRSTRFGASKSSRRLPRKNMHDMYLLNPPVIENGQHHCSYQGVYPIDSVKVTTNLQKQQKFSTTFKFTSTDGRRGVGPVKDQIHRTLEIRQEKLKAQDPFCYLEKVPQRKEKKVSVQQERPSTTGSFARGNGRSKPIGNRVAVKCGSQTGLFDINENPGPGAYNVETIVSGTRDLAMTNGQKRERYKKLLASGKIGSNYAEKQSQKLRRDLAECKLAIGGVTSTKPTNVKRPSNTFGGVAKRFQRSLSDTSLVGVNGIPQADDDKSWKNKLAYERNFGGASIGKAKDRSLPWEKNLALEYISEYRDFVPSPRGTFGENKVPMIRLMELSAQKYSAAFRSKVPVRDTRKDIGATLESDNDISMASEKKGVESKEKSEPYSFNFSTSPPRPQASIMLRSMGSEYNTKRPRFEPNADLRGPAKFHSLSKMQGLQKWFKNAERKSTS